MAWRLAKSLETFKNEINALSPKRDKSSDGGIGDAAHASRASDHNPWVKDGSMGIVTAYDITHDENDDVSGHEIAEFLRKSNDPRIKYLIWYKKIWNPAISPEWRNYTGSNPHTKHIHMSVLSSKDKYDSTAPWGLSKIITPAGAPKPNLVPTVPPKAPTSDKIYVYCMYGLGGRMFSAGIEDVLATNIRKLSNTITAPTRNWNQWRSIVEDIKKQPKGSKTVVIGHSMGAATATYVTDYVPVDLLVCYDLAGLAPSKIGKNTGHAIDIYDTWPDLVPEWRVQALPGHEGKIDLWFSRHGHVGQDDSQELMKRVVAEIKELN